MSDDGSSVDELLSLFAAAIRHIDTSGVPYKSTKPPHREYAPGVGPYSETVLCQRVALYLNENWSSVCNGACTKRFPDLLIPGRWAVELKLARPFGDNGKEAEHWSQNLLHPYPGNTSSLADAMKLQRFEGPENPVVVVVGFEHRPARLSLDPLIAAFETLAVHVLRLPIGQRHYQQVDDLIHPIHQVARVWGWPIVRSPGTK